MIVEIGMPWDAQSTSLAFIKDIVQKTVSIPNHKGLGVMYWEPEAYNWQGYTLGCFDTTCKPTIALYGFKQ
jgi:arabinogalactan endo-1,4-beta-galactosidase